MSKNQLVVSPLYNNSSYLIKRLLKKYIRPHLKKLLVAVFCMIIVAGTTAIIAWMLQPIVDDIFLNKDISLLVSVSLGFFFVSMIKGIASYGQNYIMQCIGQRIIINMQLQLYRHLLFADLSLITGESSGKIVSRFINDINILRASVVIIMTGLAKELITLIFLISLMFYQSVTLAIIAFTAFPVAIYPIMRLGRRMRKISNSTQEGLGEFTAKLDETFKSARIIKAYQQEEFEIQRATTTIEKIYRLFKKAARNQSAASPLMETIGGAAIAAVIWYGGSQVIEGATTPGKFISFIAAVMAAYKPAKSLSNMNTTLQDGLAAARRLFMLLDTQPQIIDKPNAINLASKESTIVFDKVKFSYAPNKAALKGLSLEAPAGKTIALVGPSGGGKSTIMNLILRFYDAEKGAIKINGTNITDITLSSLRDNIAYVSQNITLFDDTVAANIAYSRPQATDDEIKEAARLAAADDFISRLPDTYYTIIGQDGMSLSGGQRQRISIARAMLKNAPILLLDEATSALDPISEQKIQTALKQLMQGRTTIVIAHRLSTIENADLIYVIKNGKIVESGKHNSLIKKKGEYNKLYKSMENAEDKNK